MPFDSMPEAEVTARDRVIMLRDHLAQLPAAQFDYREWSRESEYGTVACVAGWQGILMGDRAPRFCDEDDRAAHEAWQTRMAASLGLSGRGVPLFELGGYTRRSPAEAVAVLDHYLATGKIDWEAAK